MKKVLSFIYDLHKKHGIGMRIIKTAISVHICLITMYLLKGELSFYACMGAIISMQDTLENSKKHGFNRIIATFIGGAMSVPAIFLTRNVSSPYLFQICVTVAVIATLYISNKFNKKESAAVACFVLLSVIILNKGSAPYAFAFRRFAETAYGVIVSIIINLTINFPKKKGPDELAEES